MPLSPAPIATDPSPPGLVGERIYRLAPVEADVLLDRSAPTMHATAFSAKRGSSDKGQRHLLALQPWGPNSERRDASVSQSVFRAVEPGQEVQVELHPGAFGAAWYVVRAR